MNNNRYLYFVFFITLFLIIVYFLVNKRVFILDEIPAKWGLKVIDKRIDSLYETFDVDNFIHIESIIQLSEIEKELLMQKCFFYAYNCINNELKSFNILKLIPSEKTASYFGIRCMTSKFPMMYFFELKKMPDTLKIFSLLEGLNYENVPMKDSLFNELCTVRKDLLVKILDYEDIQDKIKISIIRCLFESNRLTPIEKVHIITDYLRNNNNKYFYEYIGTNLFQKDKELFYYLLDNLIKTKDDKLLEILKYSKKQLIDCLIKMLGKNEYVENILACLGEDAMPQLIQSLNDEDKQVRFSAADALIKMAKIYPEATAFFDKEIDSQNLKFISDNYAYYIRKGLPNTEDILLKALNKYFYIRMCEDYLNCGNEYIEQKSAKIAKDHGYIICKEKGFHFGPKWGESP